MSDSKKYVVEPFKEKGYSVTRDSKCPEVIFLGDTYLDLLRAKNDAERLCLKLNSTKRGCNDSKR